MYTFTWKKAEVKLTTIFEYFVCNYSGDVTCEATYKNRKQTHEDCLPYHTYTFPSPLPIFCLVAFTDKRLVLNFNPQCLLHSTLFIKLTIWTKKESALFKQSGKPEHSSRIWSCLRCCDPEGPAVTHQLHRLEALLRDLLGKVSTRTVSHCHSSCPPSGKRP